MSEQDKAGRPEKLGLVEEAVRTALSRELEDAARDVGLGRDDLLRLARRDADAIFAPVERQFARLEESRQSQELLAESRASEQERLPHYFFSSVRYLQAIFIMVAAAAWAFLRWPLSTFEWVLAGYLAAASIASLALFPSRSGGPEKLEVEVSEERVAATEATFNRALVAEGARPWIRQQINAVIRSQQGRTLQYEDASGLAEVNDTDAPMVTTSGLRRIRELMSVMPGGTIGVAGPRGVGKSTLIRNLFRQEEASSRKTLSAVVDAPVQYDAREFSLHLFARVCEAVLGTTAVQSLRDAYRPPSADLLVRRLRMPLLVVAAGLAGIVLGLPLLFSEMESKPASVLVGAFLEIIGTAAVLLGVALVQREQAERRRRRELMRRADGGKDSATATRHLQDIWFQQSFSSGWSGSLSLPLGLEGGVEAGWELAQKQLAFPDVVSRFRDFLEILTAEHRVLIGIDEMDKMNDQTARDFLNEIKGLFRVRGCYFVVSVSDDAMTDFERRGMPFRDVFDSSFDEIVTLENFTMADSTKLIEDRVIGLPSSFIGLAHAYSGGLPRELIRFSRALIRLGEGTPLDQATRTLGSEMIVAQARAVQHRFGQLGESRSKAGLLEWLRHPWTLDQPVDRLQEWCDSIPVEHLLREAEGPHETDAASTKALTSIRELVLLGYFSLTTIELFDRFVADELSRDELTGKSSVAERLGSVRQAFSVSRGIAWSMLDEYRKETDLRSLRIRL